LEPAFFTGVTSEGSGGSLREGLDCFDLEEDGDLLLDLSVGLEVDLAFLVVETFMML